MIDAADIDVVHVANALGKCSPGGAISARCRPPCTKARGTPATRHGRRAHPAAWPPWRPWLTLRAGNYRTALVVGLELEKTVPGDLAAQHLGAAAWTGHGPGRRLLWPSMFDGSPGTTGATGIDDTHLRAIAAVNLANARQSERPDAHGPVPDLAAVGDDDEINPPIEGRIRQFDCSQMTDGGPVWCWSATRFWPNIQGAPDQPDRGVGAPHRRTGLGQKLDRDAGNPLLLPHVRTAIHDAFSRAGGRIASIDGFEVRLLHTERVRGHRPHRPDRTGRVVEAIENGDIEIGGRLPINPSGGLIGGGHPVGATGIRMILDAAKQVSEPGGDYQVDGARRFGTLNFGGSTATTVSFVIGSSGSGVIGPTNGC